MVVKHAVSGWLEEEAGRLEDCTCPPTTGPLFFTMFGQMEESWREEDFTLGPGLQAGPDQRPLPRYGYCALTGGYNNAVYTYTTSCEPYFVCSGTGTVTRTRSWVRPAPPGFLLGPAAQPAAKLHSVTARLEEGRLAGRVQLQVSGPLVHCGGTVLVAVQ